MISSTNRLIMAQSFRSLFFAGPIFTLFLLAKGLTLQQTLTILSVLLISGILFEIPTGVFADKYGRKWSMVAGTFISAGVWFLWLNIHTFIGFAFAYALFGLANAFCSGSDQALIYDELKSTSREADAQKVFSRYNGAGAVTYGIAAFVGSLIAFFIILRLITYFLR